MLVKAGVRGVDLSFLPAVIWAAIKIVALIWEKEEIVITSTTEGTHLSYSFHYRCLAIDIRKSIYTDRNLRLKEVLSALGYDVVIKSDHIHIEYDPKE